MADATLLDGELRLAGRLDARFFALLAAIDGSGSINRAARAAGYSYKGAWLVLETAANLSAAPLLERATGGKGGGGTRLTDAGRALLATWAGLQRAHTDFLRTQEALLIQQPAIAALLRRIAMKITARNQFAGTVRAIEAGPVTTALTLALAGGQEIVATMTTAAAGQLQAAVGKEAIALVKSSAVVLVTDFAGYRLSARNQFAGTVSRVERGAVSSLVGLTLPGGAVLTASVTNDAIDALGIAVGQPATAVVKAYSVMVAMQA